MLLQIGLIQIGAPGASTLAVGTLLQSPATAVPGVAEEGGGRSTRLNSREFMFP